jgi:integral membrane protein
MAYVVGCLLVVLVCIGMPLEYIWHDDRLVSVAGVAHGWLYMVLIITAVDLGRRVRWPWWRIGIIALAGTIPFVTFVAEHYATKDARLRITEAEAAEAEAAEEPAA